MKRAVVVACLLTGCVRPADERAMMDLEVGNATSDDWMVSVTGGLAQVRTLEDDTITLWAQAPSFELTASSTAIDDRALQITVLNVMPGAELTGSVDGISVRDAGAEGPRPTVRTFLVPVAAGAELTARIAPPDADVIEPWRFAEMGDIQTALDRVDEVFAVIRQDDQLRFVMSTGDIVESGFADEYELWFEQLESLPIPYYSTIGNHELRSNIERWHRDIGLYSVHFDFKGVAFSFVDSGNASLDPIVYDRLDEWLDDARDRIHLFGTHYPAFDPIGVRNSAFRSRKEGAKLIGRLIDGEVDVTFYGHLHSYYAFSNGDIPAYISGGGGAIPERFDGVGRHFLSVDVNPVENRVDRVALVRVD